MNKPFSQACENNNVPILEVLRSALTDARSVLEIGSGSGQHAVFFAREMPWLSWQCSDLDCHLAGISSWIGEAGLINCPHPLALDVSQPYWPQGYDAVFTANTLHIMSWPLVGKFFEGVGRLLPTAGRLCIYGPFNYSGEYTSDSNARFDQWLRQRDPLSGIRDFEALQELAENQGLSLLADHAMPANNRLLVFIR